MEIDRLETLRALLDDPAAQALRSPGDKPGPRGLSGLRLQDLDLHAVEDRLLGRTDVHGLVVLGGRLSPKLTLHLVQHGAIVFPTDPEAPVDVYRSRLYTAAELYAGLDGPRGYAGTPDGRAYVWTLRHPNGGDAYVAMLRAIHDESLTDALDDAVRGQQVVGVMGGHAAQRGSDVYAAAARLGHTLAEAGLVVVTGGGPGAMEAANLGAFAADRDALERAQGWLAQVPGYRPDIAHWAHAGLSARARLREQEADEPLRSVSMPTWFYGHEPPNVFGQGIAKYFSNALREDGLVSRCNAGIVVLPGAAGTVQEIFQIATRLYYGRCPVPALPPLVLVGPDWWTRQMPAWPMLQALGAGRPMAHALHLVDSVEEATAIVTAGPA